MKRGGGGRPVPVIGNGGGKRTGKSRKGNFFQQKSFHWGGGLEKREKFPKGGSTTGKEVRKGPGGGHIVLDSPKGGFAKRGRSGGVRDIFL